SRRAGRSPPPAAAPSWRWKRATPPTTAGRRSIARNDRVAAELERREHAHRVARDLDRRHDLLRIDVVARQRLVAHEELHALLAEAGCERGVGVLALMAHVIGRVVEDGLGG